MSEEINKAEETKVEEESLAAEETRMISDEARWYFRGQRTPAGRC